ncbi:hypothetical protein WBP07_00285 [Novosphingobium sp. BL-8A]|uniref:hypothetical protein n=1 Tax=Novosphingobium sp. BL-8A TaxID=3127639 RepID=UPI0037568D3A
MRRLFLTGGLLASAALSGCSDKPQIACSPSRSHWSPPEEMGPEAVYNTLTLDRNGMAYWNGSPVDDAVLDRMLKATRRFDPIPQLVLQTEMGMPCARLEAVRDKIDNVLDCRRNGRVCSEGERTPAPMPAQPRS